jgi:DNA-directed RNA polymerase specialized sigma24 family protein
MMPADTKRARPELRGEFSASGKVRTVRCCSAPPTIPLSDDDHRWFSDHVQPHDAALRAWLRGRFPTLGDTDDLVQETYTRVLQLRARDPLREHAVKPLLFTTARHLTSSATRSRSRSGRGHEAVRPRARRPRPFPRRRATPLGTPFKN